MLDTTSAIETPKVEAQPSFTGFQCNGFMNLGLEKKAPSLDAAKGAFEVEAIIAGPAMAKHYLFHDLSRNQNRLLEQQLEDGRTLQCFCEKGENGQSNYTVRLWEGTTVSGLSGLDRQTANARIESLKLISAIGGGEAQRLFKLFEKRLQQEVTGVENKATSLAAELLDKESKTAEKHDWKFGEGANGQVKWLSFRSGDAWATVTCDSRKGYPNFTLRIEIPAPIGTERIFGKVVEFGGEPAEALWRRVTQTSAEAQASIAIDSAEQNDDRFGRALKLLRMEAEFRQLAGLDLLEKELQQKDCRTSKVRDILTDVIKRSSQQVRWSAMRLAGDYLEAEPRLTEALIYAGRQSQGRAEWESNEVVQRCIRTLLEMRVDTPEARLIYASATELRDQREIAKLPHSREILKQMGIWENYSKLHHFLEKVGEGVDFTLYSSFNGLGRAMLAGMVGVMGAGAVCGLSSLFGHPIPGTLASSVVDYSAISSMALGFAGSVAHDVYQLFTGKNLFDRIEVALKRARATK